MLSASLTGFEPEVTLEGHCCRVSKSAFDLGSRSFLDARFGLFR
jgi:hypothetical protein